MTRLPASYVPATWRNVTPVDAGSRTGGFVTPSGGCGLKHGWGHQAAQGAAPASLPAQRVGKEVPSSAIMARLGLTQAAIDPPLHGRHSGRRLQPELATRLETAGHPITKKAPCLGRLPLSLPVHHCPKFSPRLRRGLRAFLYGPEG
jgi:hypothetical protein